ncbi:MAG: tetratricopeptide repeat protein [Treponema sp.]|nr:tetratricopeptide repeat protein [Treponema sp.]
MPRQNKLALAVEEGKKRNYREAAELLQELISETDAPPEAWLLLGRSLHALGDYSRAIAAFNDYIAQNPRSPEGYLFAGRSYLAAGLPYRAVPFLRKAVENNPAPAAKALLGVAYLKSRHSEAAVQTLQEAVETAPDNKRIYRAYLNSLLVRGVRLCRAGDYELGVQMLRFVSENMPEAGMPDNPFLRLELGRAARETGNLPEALEHFTQALRLAGDDRGIRWSRVGVLMAMGRNGEAKEEIDRIRSSGAWVPDTPLNRELVDICVIMAFLEAGEWRRAADSCGAWLKFRDDRPLIRAFYAEALRNMGDFKAAHNHLHLALKAEPDKLEFWYADIMVSWEAKDYKSLKKALKAAKSLGGDAAIIKRFSVLCQARTSDDTKGNITLLQNAIRTLEPDPELMYALAGAYLKIGLLEEAVSWFEKTIVLKNDHEEAWLGKIAALEAIAAAESSEFRPGEEKAPESRSDKEAASALGAAYEAYLEKWPDNSSIRRDRALFLIKTLEYAEAASELEKLLIGAPSNFSLRRVLAYAYRKTGRFREAAVFLKALLKEKPWDIGLIIEYSGCLERAGAGKYALAILEKARDALSGSDRSTGSPDISLALGILNFRHKKTEKAFDCLREAAALAPSDPRPYEWMAIIARKIGETERIDYYEREAEKRRKKQL